MKLRQLLHLSPTLLLAPVLLSAASVRIFQTNAGGDVATVIDPATNKIVMTIPDLEVAHGVGFSPDGKRAYFTVESDSTVKSVDIATGKITGSVKLSGHPNNMSVSKNGKYVFAGIHVAPGGVDVIDTATMKLVKTLPVKGAVHNTYVTPDGKYMIGASVFGSIFEVFDAETLEHVWELKMSSGVRPIAFEKAADGSTSRMFVQLSDVHGFAVVDFKQRKEVSRVMLPEEPKGGRIGAQAPAHGIGITPDGKTMLVDSSIADGVFFYSMPDLKYLGYVATGKTPDWLTFTPDGKVAYVANSGSNTVSAVDVATRKVIATIPVGQAPKRNGTVIVP
jgi:YVTN family beta-propeller protein